MVFVHFNAKLCTYHYVDILDLLINCITIDAQKYHLPQSAHERGGGNAACSCYPPSLESLTFGGLKSIPLNDFLTNAKLREITAPVWSLIGIELGMLRIIYVVFEFSVL